MDTVSKSTDVVYIFDVQ